MFDRVKFDICDGMETFFDCQGDVIICPVNLPDIFGCNDLTLDCCVCLAGF